MTDFAMFGAVAFETLAVATIFVFRRRIPATPENRPYRCWGYPVVPALYVAIMAAVLVNFFVNPEQRSEALIGLGFIGVGAACTWPSSVDERGEVHSVKLESLLLFLCRLCVLVLALRLDLQFPG